MVARTDTGLDTERTEQLLEAHRAEILPAADLNTLRMQYAGSIGLLCDLSIHLSHGPDRPELQDLIERAVNDWCKATGWTYGRTMHRIEVFPPA